MNETSFEILVYTCDQKSLLNHITEKAKKEMASVPNFGNGIWLEQLNDSIKREGKPIRYNELVGCIDVYIFSGQLRADYWFTDKKRILIGSKVKGVIRPRGKIMEINYNGSRLSSPEIFCEFRQALEKVARKHWKLKNRFIDFSAFDRIGPYVDWRGALKLRKLDTKVSI